MVYDFDMLLADVAKFLKVSGLSENTKKLYGFFLGEFFDWVRKAKKNPEKVDAGSIAEWFSTRPQWSTGTKHNAIASVREFYRYRYGANHPICYVRVKRVPAGPQRSLEENELTTLLAGIDTTTPIGVRDLAIITLMADTGLRASEVCNLQLKNLNIPKTRLLALVKGGEWVEKHFFDYTASCLENWLAIRSIFTKPDTKTVFCSINGLKPGTPLTRFGIRDIFTKLGEKTKLGKITPHDMRRTFATLATEAGAPTRMVQLAGGWKSIRMVEHYTRNVKPEKFRPYSPVNRAMGLVDDQNQN